jgi:hypothetical protein
MVQWRKSSYSGGVNDEACVEVARLSAGLTGVRDSKHPDGGSLRLTAPKFADLLEQIKSGNLDR